MLYVFYVLITDFVNHDRKELAFYNMSQNVFNRLNIPVALPVWNPIPERSAGLYIVLSLIIPFFVLYVLWILIKDPNKHFQFHHRMEETLIKVIQ